MMSNIFLMGASGSGKSTIQQMITRDYKDYIHLRIAGTIKDIICEREGLTMDELEVLKRTDKKFRDEHFKVSAYLENSKSAINRLKGFLNGTHRIYETSPDFLLRPKVIVDVRTQEEMNLCLDAGYTGIILTRAENKSERHYTSGGLEYTKKCILQAPNKDNIHVIVNSMDSLSSEVFNSGIHTYALGDVSAEILSAFSNQLILNASIK